MSPIWFGVLAICLAWAATARAAEAGRHFYVSPTGEDRNPGTKDKPFATVACARDAVRKLVAGGLTEPVTVVLADGVYEQAAPLVLGPEDSGTAEHAITYRGAPGPVAVLSGGRRITGWTKGKDEVWQTTVPGVKEGQWYFRQLWVNGRRAVRARTPNLGAKPSGLQLKGAKLSQDLKSHTYQFAPGVLKEWRNLAEVEAVVVGNWEITRKFFASVDAASGAAQMAGPHARPHDAIGPAPGRWFHIENALEA
jgi:hypothetical protein